MSNWVPQSLGDLITLQRGFDITKAAQSDGIYPVVSSSGITSFHDQFMAEGPGVVIGLKGTLGSAFFVPGNYWPHDTTLWVKDFKGNDEKFVYYLLKILPLGKLDSGSANPTLNRNYAHLLAVTAPSPTEQRRVAAVLSALDAKIDLNHRINKELEALAKTIYDYWFVQFDFPDAHGRPYKSNGGAMAWNDTLKREIPAGWDVKHLNELLEARSDGVSASGVIEGTPYTPIDSLPMRKMSFGFVRPSTEANTSLIRYRKGDILIGAMRVYFHRVCVAPFDGVTRATTLVLRAKVGDHLPYLYQVCNEDRTIEMASKLSVGTQQPYINWENRLENYSIPYPRDDGLIQKYVAATESFVSAVVNRELENAYLAQLRDWLLPLLMNGQVRVA